MRIVNVYTREESTFRTRSYYDETEMDYGEFVLYVEQHRNKKGAWKKAKILIHPERSFSAEDIDTLMPHVKDAITLLNDWNKEYQEASRQITEKHRQRITLGNRMREDRRARRISLKEEAERLGCDPLELTLIEEGYKPDTDAGRKALAIRKQELSNNDAISSV